MREVRWLEEQKTLTLTGEPVLECRYAWPETGQKKLDRYYRRLKGQWQRRWERELYWDACLDLAGKRERSCSRRRLRRCRAGGAAPRRRPC